MNNHFCKVGYIRPNLRKALSLNELENLYNNFIVEAYNLIQSDTKSSDILYNEAFKMKKTILTLKESHLNAADASF